jgi:ADP-ribose pyrophosphatase YjhB (NUDIX family)
MIPQPLVFLLRSYWRISRGLTLGVRGLAVDEAGRVMLVRHGYVAGWHLPGGGVEHGQTAEEALAAEMAEEAGLEVKGAPELVGVYSHHAEHKFDHVLLYRVPAWTPCAPRARKAEIVERGFFALDALPDGASRATRARLAEIFHGAPRSAHW